jgi:hypothetical protein
MVLLYFSTNGRDWLDQENWLDPYTHECDWSPGILCKEDMAGQRNVIGLDNTRNGLHGQIPEELRALDYLRK